MSKFNVDTDGLRSASGQCDWISSNISNLARQIQDVKYDLDDDMYSYSGVLDALNTCITNSFNCKTKVGWYGLYCNSIANKYSETERIVYENISVPNWIRELTPNKSDVKSESSWGPYDYHPFDWSSFILDTVFGGMGTTGSILNTVYKTSKKGWKGGIPGLIKLVGKVVSNSSGGKINWGDVFKLTSDVRHGPLKTALGKYTNFSTLEKGFGTACNWIAEISASGIDNAEEFGPSWATNPRFYGETGIEALLNIGKGIVVGAGVTAILGVAGITTATFGGAVAIGAATAGAAFLVNAGLNAFTVWVTNGSEAKWTEAISNKICDTTEWTYNKAVEGGKIVADTAIETGKNVVNTVTEVGNAISHTMNSVGDVVANSFGNVCNWGRLSPA